jgi:tripartite-type tricarboxylate transporter receptor subunit TctC
VQDRLKKLSAEIVGGSIDATAKFMQKEIERWNAVIKTANVKMQ